MRTMIEGTTLEGCGKKIPSYIDLRGGDGTMFTVPVHTTKDPYKIPDKTNRKMFPHYERETAQINDSVDQGSSFQGEIYQTNINPRKRVVDVAGTSTGDEITTDSPWNSKGVGDHCETPGDESSTILPHKRPRADDKHDQSADNSQKVSSIYIKIEEE